MNPESPQKKEIREMYSPEDVGEIGKYIKENSLEKIYVVGAIGSGKSSFADELSASLNYTNIDLDDYSQLLASEKGSDSVTQKEILEFALSKNTQPYVINHADILDQGLLGDADLVVLLNPSKEELLKTRQMREDMSMPGDWKNITPDKYEGIIERNASSFEVLPGKVVYYNDKSGTKAKRKYITNTI